MAAQLNPSRLRMLLDPSRDFAIPARILTIGCIAIATITMASILIGTWQAQRDRDAALQRYVDTQALLALPPVDSAALRDERDEALAAAAQAQALLAPPSVDPASDAAIALLVRTAETNRLRVTGVQRVPDAQLTDVAISYDVLGVRVSVEGALSDVVRFLFAMETEEPGFVPALDALTVTDAGVAHAEIVFKVYTEVVVPTAVVPLEIPQ